jgi:teichuronic acid biosynthesis glycosyltransferase TuaC
MNILFFSSAYPTPWQPGLGTFNRTMLAGLAESQTVRAVVPVPFPLWFRRPSEPVASFQAAPSVPATYRPYYYVPKLWREQYHRWMDWSVGQELRSQIRCHQPDVVLSYWAHPDGAVATAAARECGVPSVLMVGGSDVLLLARSGRRRTAVLSALHQADQVITVSEHLAATLRSDGLPPEKIAVIPRGIDTQVFGPGDRVAARRQLDLSSDLPVLIGVGRLVDVKDWPNWIDAIRRLHQQGCRLSAHLLGDGPLKPLLQAMIDQAGLADVVHLEGRQTQGRLAVWYRAADLTVLSSTSEGIPNVLLESVASGTPFVATNVGGVSEVADQARDVLVPAQSSEQLAQAIFKQLSRLPDIQGIRANGPQPLSVASQRLSALLHQVAEQHSHGRRACSVTSTVGKGVPAIAASVGSGVSTWD